jgi:hypothetical protein
MLSANVGQRLESRSSDPVEDYRVEERHKESLSGEGGSSSGEAGSPEGEDSGLVRAL